MPVMAVMGVVVAYDATIITSQQVVVDVREVVAGDLAGHVIHPDFPP